MLKMQVFWHMMSCRWVYSYRLPLDYLEEGGSKLLRNVGACFPLYTASYSWIHEPSVTLLLVRQELNLCYWDKFHVSES